MRCDEEEEKYDVNDDPNEEVSMRWRLWGQ
jgi:hypothetical protein